MVVASWTLKVSLLFNICRSFQILCPKDDVSKFKKGRQSVRQTNLSTAEPTTATRIIKCVHCSKQTACNHNICVHYREGTAALFWLPNYQFLVRFVERKIENRQTFLVE
uniref:Secreted protein n=1 Tax=Arundo donax TaxID=35708 RepID=A0A0A9FAN7_ARUDO